MSELDGTHIGQRIRFTTVDRGRDIETVVTAELRQIYHVGGRTTLTYGYGAEQEQEFYPDEVVTLHPDVAYDDAPHLIVVNAEREIVRDQNR